MTARAAVACSHGEHPHSDERPTPAYRSAAAWIEQSLACLAEAVERMDGARFLAEHQGAHDAPRSPSVDMVAAVLEREWWKRWPEGRDQ